MIFRRLAQYLRDQNWPAIVIEFVLLVVGVFLGIQVANWNEDRQDRVAEQRYLRELVRDLKTDIDTLQQRRRDALAKYALTESIILHPHISWASVTRAPRWRRGAARGPEGRVGVVDTTSSGLEGARRATAHRSAAAVEGS